MGGYTQSFTALVGALLLLAAAVHQCPATATVAATTEHHPSQLAGYGTYTVGTGIADVTGPVAQVALQGYSLGNQTGAGLHMRQFARALYVEDTAGSSVTFLHMDVWGCFGLVKQLVLDHLSASGLGEVFRADNLVISGTHTHSGPGGFSPYFLYNTATLGLVQETLTAVVTGLAEAAVRAYEGRQEGVTITSASGNLIGASRNRSPAAYERNPEWTKVREEDRLPQVELNHSVIRYVTRNGEPLALQSFFPVHATSINNTNQLVSSDNKGYAAYLIEREFNGQDTPHGTGRFIAQFFQANEGDVTPNIEGEFCYATPDGFPCDRLHSSCDRNTKSAYCRAYGPGGFDGFRSATEIGRRQAEHARALWDLAAVENTNNHKVITGPIHTAEKTLHLEEQEVGQEWTAKMGDKSKPRTCRAAVGVPVFAGTTDGPGFHTSVLGKDVAFEQATREPCRPDQMTSEAQMKVCRTFDKSLDAVQKLMIAAVQIPAEPEPADLQCQYPKRVGLFVGGMKFQGPTLQQWVARNASTQVIAIGHHAFVALPGEFTTTSGRRVRADVERALAWKGATAHLIGLANEYTGYITTPEEYDVQRYEGASTLYGPHTLGLYRQAYDELARAIRGKSIDVAQGKGTAPSGTCTADGDCGKKGKSKGAAKRGGYHLGKFIAGPIVNKLQSCGLKLPLDEVGHRKWGTSSSSSTKFVFGSPIEPKPRPEYKVGETAVAWFVGSNPRRSLEAQQQEGAPPPLVPFSFMYVERQTPATATGVGAAQSWKVVATDADWVTRFHWYPTDVPPGSSGFGAWVHKAGDKFETAVFDKLESSVALAWEIPAGQEPGRYRLRYVGHYQTKADKGPQRFEGVSDTFTVVSPTNK